MDLILEERQVPESGQRSLVRHAGRSIVVFNVEGRLHAIEDDCPHAGAALCTGRLNGHYIQCPAHGLHFDLRTGEMKGNPGLRVPVFAVQTRQGRFVLELPAPHSTQGDTPP